MEANANRSEPQVEKSAPETPAGPRRPRWRLHVSTWAVLLLLLPCLAAVVAVGDYVPDGWTTDCQHGWPLVFLHRQPPQRTAAGSPQSLSLWSWTDAVTKFDAPALAVDMALAAALLAAVAAAAEWRRRRRKRFWQVTLREGLFWTLLLALACGYVAREVQHTQAQRRALQKLEQNSSILFYAEWDARGDGIARLLGQEWYPEETPRIGRVSVLEMSTGRADFTLRQIGKLTDLRYLGLCCEAPPGELRPPLNELGRLKRLKTLQLRSLANDDGLAHVAGLRELEWLDLSNNDVTDAGLAHLENLTQLETLNLAHNEITDAGLVHLEGLRRLKYLDLTNTQVTEEGIHRLLKALPGVEVTDD